MSSVRGSGPPLVVLHGFTQTGRLWGPFGELLAAGPHAGRRRPARPRRIRTRSGPTCRTTAASWPRPSRDAVGDEPCALLGYSLGRARGAARGDRRAIWPSRRVVFIGVTAGIEDPAARRAAARCPTTRWPTSSRPPATSSASSTRGCSGPMFDRLVRGCGRTARSASATRASGLAVQPAAVRDRHAGALVGPPARALAAPCWPWPGRRHPLRRARAALGPPRRRTASPPWFPGAAMPSTWPNRSRPAGSGPSLARDGRAGPRLSRLVIGSLTAAIRP